MMGKKTKELTLEEKLEQALVPKEEWPYKVPENWCWVHLRSCLHEIKNGTTIKQDKSGKGYFVTRIESIQNYTIDFERLGTIIEENKIKESDWYKAGDIALSHINSSEHVGKTAVITDEMLPLVHGMNLLRLRMNGLCVPKYFYYYSQSYQYKYEISTRINMAVNQVSINQKQLGDIEFPVAPLAEQQRIVDCIKNLFAKLDEVREIVKRVMENVECTKDIMLHQAFLGEYTKRWRIKNGISMESWEKGMLGEYLFPMKTKKPSGKEFRYIDIDSIDNERQCVKNAKMILTSEAPSRASRGVDLGDVLFSMVRPYLKNIAYVGEAFTDCIVSTGFYVCSCRDSLDSKFLYEFLRSKDAIDYLMQFMKGDNSPSIRKSDLLGMPMWIPTKNEQKMIVKIVQSILTNYQLVKETSTEILEKTELIKKAILAKAFRGELGTNIEIEENPVNFLKTNLR